MRPPSPHWRDAANTVRIPPSRPLDSDSDDRTEFFESRTGLTDDDERGLFAAEDEVLGTQPTQPDEETMAYYRRQAEDDAEVEKGIDALKLWPSSFSGLNGAVALQRGRGSSACEFARGASPSKQDSTVPRAAAQFSFTTSNSSSFAFGPGFSSDWSSSRGTGITSASTSFNRSFRKEKQAAADPNHSAVEESTGEYVVYDSSSSRPTSSNQAFVDIIPPKPNPGPKKTQRRSMDGKERDPISPREGGGVAKRSPNNSLSRSPIKRDSIIARKRASILASRSERPGVVAEGRRLKMDRVEIRTKSRLPPKVAEVILLDGPADDSDVEMEGVADLSTSLPNLGEKEMERGSLGTRGRSFSDATGFSVATSFDRAMLGMCSPLMHSSFTNNHRLPRPLLPRRL